MDIWLICIGKIKDSYIDNGIKEFTKRLQPFINLKLIELKESNNESNLKISIDKESEKIIKFIEKLNSYNILLDVSGNQMGSVEMSEHISALQVRGISRISFIIGGSNGVNENLKNLCDLKLSFSKFTFPHQLMRLIFFEQLYRWFSIINNLKYHK